MHGLIPGPGTEAVCDNAPRVQETWPVTLGRCPLNILEASQQCSELASASMPFRPWAGTEGGIGGKTVTTLQTGPFAALNTWARTSHEWEMSARLLQKTKPTEVSTERDLQGGMGSYIYGG